MLSSRISRPVFCSSGPTRRPLMITQPPKKNCPSVAGARDGPGVTEMSVDPLDLQRTDEHRCVDRQATFRTIPIRGVVNAILLAKAIVVEGAERNVCARANSDIAGNAQRDRAKPHAQPCVHIGGPGTREIERQGAGAAIDVDVLDVRVSNSRRFDRRGADVEPERSHSSGIWRRKAKRRAARGGLDGQLIDSQPAEIQIRLDGAEIGRASCRARAEGAWPAGAPRS